MDEFVQLSIVLARSMEDGTYEFVHLGEGGSGAFVSHAGIITLLKGAVSFKRDKVSKTIEVVFETDFEYDEEHYHISSESVFLKATGPL
ncbi:hypothetical protein [Pseudomonas sp. NPDC087614]|uniref:hypothetical protein n=1 Tax=Pseudomonas sp. NPDC087614 TaxID=3364442 RepID=UPI0037FB65A7